jgi:hypothetical protein
VGRHYSLLGSGQRQCRWTTARARPDPDGPRTAAFQRSSSETRRILVVPCVCLGAVDFARLAAVPPPSVSVNTTLILMDWPARARACSTAHRSRRSRSRAQLAARSVVRRWERGTERISGRRLLRPLSQRRMRRRNARGSTARWSAGPGVVVVGLLPGSAELRFDSLTVALGEMVKHAPGRGLPLGREGSHLRARPSRAHVSSALAPHPTRGLRLWLVGASTSRWRLQLAAGPSVLLSGDMMRPGREVIKSIEKQPWTDCLWS